MLAIIIVGIVIGIWIGAKVEHRDNVRKIGEHYLNDHKGRKR